MRKLTLALLALPLLTACSLTEPRDVGNANRIMLHATAEAQDVKQKRGTLSIQLPEAPTALDTYRIAVTLADGRDDYIAGARWNDFLTSMVQETLRDNFAQSHLFTHTNTDNELTQSKFLLRTEIRNFSAIYSAADQAPTIKVKLGFTLKRASDGKVLKQFSEGAEQVAAANSVTAIHEAFDIAFNKVSDAALERIAAAAK